MNAETSDLVFLPFGGVGEIGMNLAAYGLGTKQSRKWLIVDFGVAFAGDDIEGFVGVRVVVRHQRLIQLDQLRQAIGAAGNRRRLRRTPSDPVLLDQSRDVDDSGCRIDGRALRRDRWRWRGRRGWWGGQRLERHLDVDRGATARGEFTFDRQEPVALEPEEIGPGGKTLERDAAALGSHRAGGRAFNSHEDAGDRLPVRIGDRHRKGRGPPAGAAALGIHTGNGGAADQYSNE